MDERPNGHVPHATSIIYRKSKAKARPCRSALPAPASKRQRIQPAKLVTLRTAHTTESTLSFPQSVNLQKPRCFMKRSSF